MDLAELAYRAIVPMALVAATLCGGMMERAMQEKRDDDAGRQADDGSRPADDAGREVVGVPDVRP